jgi:hypothetical protein
MRLLVCCRGSQRHHQLLIPALRLLVAMLAANPHNVPLHRHVIE